MPVLHNRISNAELKLRMLRETEPRITISFYKYFYITDPRQFRDDLYVKFDAIKVFGRVYIAHEGINGQISVPESNKDTLRDMLYAADPALNGIRLNVAVDDDGKSFWVLRMKVRNKEAKASSKHCKGRLGKTSTVLFRCCEELPCCSSKH